nr:MAG TPA: hypothetical protein [Caudoviricetes sp.]
MTYCLTSITIFAIISQYLFLLFLYNKYYTDVPELTY